MPLAITLPNITPGLDVWGNELNTALLAIVAAINAATPSGAVPLNFFSDSKGVLHRSHWSSVSIDPATDSSFTVSDGDTWVQLP